MIVGRVGAVALLVVLLGACEKSERGGNTGTLAGGGQGSSVGPGAFRDEATVARATIALTSCTSDDGIARTLEILRGVQGGFSYAGGSEFIECVAAVSNGCDGVMSCFGISMLTGSETCNTCQGNVAVYCGVDGDLLWDCSATGGTCREGECFGPGDVPCEDLFMAECDESGRPTTCEDFVRHGPVCADFGLTCATNDFGTQVMCQGAGEACTGGSDGDLSIAGSACEGDVLQGCVGGRTGAIDCRDLGPNFSCQSFAGAFFCGLASECDPASNEYTCAGTQITFCDAGQLTTLDCTSYGFTACQEGMRMQMCL